MASFVFDTLTADSRPLAVCVLCRGREREIKESLRRLENMEFGAYRSGYTVDYRLSEMIDELLGPYEEDIAAFGATVKIEDAACRTGGIIGGTNRRLESAQEGSFSSGGLSFFTSPGKFAFAVEGEDFCPSENVIREMNEKMDVKSLYNTLMDSGREFIFIFDGSGGGCGAAAVRGDIILLSETEIKNNVRKDFFGFKRIGIMGGTFDPIHYGHLIAAEAVREELSLDSVIFMPTGKTTYKKGRTSEGRHRYIMTALAARNNPAFIVSSIELERPGYSYTADTIARVRENCDKDTEIWFITGSDVLEYMTCWRDFSVLKELCSFAAVNRPGCRNDDALKRLALAGAEVKKIDIPGIEISSSMIRERIRLDKTVRYLMPEAVEEYIGLHGLYKEGTGEMSIESVLDKLI